MTFPHSSGVESQGRNLFICLTSRHSILQRERSRFKNRRRPINLRRENRVSSSYVTRLGGCQYRALADESHRSRSRRHSELLVIPFQESYLWNVIDKNNSEKFRRHGYFSSALAPFSTNKQARKSCLRSSHKLE